MEPFCVFLKALSVCSIAVFGAASLLRAESPISDAPPIVPRSTRVLLLQPIDATVDSARLQPARQRIIRLRQQYEFISRQFVVLGEEMAAKAAAAPPPLGVDGSAAGRSADTLDEWARRAKADWVVSILVREIKTDHSDDAQFKVHSTLLVQVRDSRRHSWIANRTYIGRLSGGGAPGRLFIESLRASTGEALASVLAAYPPVVTVARDGSIVDYLAGQNAPFVGDPGTPFHGLTAMPENGP